MEVVEGEHKTAETGAEYLSDAPTLPIIPPGISEVIGITNNVPLTSDSVLTERDTILLQKAGIDDPPTRMALTLTKTADGKHPFKDALDAAMIVKELEVSDSKSGWFSKIKYVWARLAGITQEKIPEISVIESEGLDQLYDLVENHMQVFAQWLQLMGEDNVEWRMKLSKWAFTPLMIIARGRHITFYEQFTDILQKWWLIRSGYAFLTGRREVDHRKMTDYSFLTESVNFVATSDIYTSDEVPWQQEWLSQSYAEQVAQLMMGRLHAYLDKPERRHHYKLDQGSPDFTFGMWCQNKRYFLRVPMAEFQASEENRQRIYRDIVNQINHIMVDSAANEHAFNDTEFLALRRLSYAGSHVIKDTYAAQVFAAEAEVILDGITAQQPVAFANPSRYEKLIQGGNRAIEALTFIRDANGKVTSIVVKNAHMYRQGKGSQLEVYEGIVPDLLRQYIGVPATTTDQPMTTCEMLPLDEERQRWRQNLKDKQEFQLPLEWHWQQEVPREQVNDWLRRISKLISEKKMSVSLADVICLARLLSENKTSLHTPVSRTINVEGRQVEVLDVLIYFLPEELGSNFPRFLQGELGDEEQAEYTKKLVDVLKLNVLSKRKVTKEGLFGAPGLFASLALNIHRVQKLTEWFSNTLAGATITEGVAGPKGGMISSTDELLRHPSSAEWAEIFAAGFKQKIVTMLRLTDPKQRMTELQKIAQQNNWPSDGAIYVNLETFVKKNAKNNDSLLLAWEQQLNLWRQRRLQRGIDTAISDIYRYKDHAMVIADAANGEEGKIFKARATPDMMVQDIIKAIQMYFIKNRENSWTANINYTDLPKTLKTYFQDKIAGHDFDFSNLRSKLVELSVPEEQLPGLFKSIDNHVFDKGQVRLANLVTAIEKVIELLENAT